MMKYEILFLDHGSQVFSHATMQAENDKAAVVLARRIHNNGIGSGYQILRNGTVIHFEEYRPVGALTFPKHHHQGQHA